MEDPINENSSSPSTLEESNVNIESRKTRADAEAIAMAEEEKFRHERRKLERETQAAIMAEKQRSVRERSLLEDRIIELENAMQESELAMGRKQKSMILATDEANRGVAAKEAEIMKLQERIKVLEASVESKELCVKTLTEKCEGLGAAVATAERCQEHLRTEVDEHRGQADRASERVERLSAEGNRLRDVVTAKDETISQLEALVNQLRAHQDELEEEGRLKESDARELEETLYELDGMRKAEEEANEARLEEVVTELEAAHRQIQKRDTLLEAKGRALMERDRAVEELVTKLEQSELEIKEAERTCMEREGQIETEREVVARLQDRVEWLQKDRRNAVENEAHWLKRVQTMVETLGQGGTSSKTNNGKKEPPQGTAADVDNDPTSAVHDGVSVMTEPTMLQHHSGDGEPLLEDVMEHSQERLDTVDAVETIGLKVDRIERAEDLNAALDELEQCTKKLTDDLFTARRAVVDLDARLAASAVEADSHADRAVSLEKDVEEIKRRLNASETKVAELRSQLNDEVERATLEKAEFGREVTTLTKNVARLQEKEHALASVHKSLEAATGYTEDVSNASLTRQATLLSTLDDERLILASAVSKGRDDLDRLMETGDDGGLLALVESGRTGLGLEVEGLVTKLESLQQKEKALERMVSSVEKARSADLASALAKQAELFAALSEEQARIRSVIEEGQRSVDATLPDAKLLTKERSNISNEIVGLVEKAQLLEKKEGVLVRVVESVQSCRAILHEKEVFSTLANQADIVSALENERVRMSASCGRSRRELRSALQTVYAAGVSSSATENGPKTPSGETATPATGTNSSSSPLLELPTSTRIAGGGGAKAEPSERQRILDNIKKEYTQARGRAGGNARGRSAVPSTSTATTDYGRTLNSVAVEPLTLEISPEEIAAERERILATIRSGNTDDIIDDADSTSPAGILSKIRRERSLSRPRDDVEAATTTTPEHAVEPPMSPSGRSRGSKSSFTSALTMSPSPREKKTGAVIAKIRRERAEMSSTKE